MSEHGTRSRYTRGCRCEACRQANTDYVRAWDRRVHGRAPQKHGRAPTCGTLYGYNRGCRCALCRFAKNLDHRRRRAAAPVLPPGDPRHGLNGYGNYDCRCEVCYAAKSDANRRQRLAREARAS